MTCQCSSCLPTGAPNQCSVCGQEVRLGWRHGQRAWLHREDVDHFAVLGHRIIGDALIEALGTRARVVAEDGNDDAASKDDEDEEPEYDGEIPEPEVACHPITVDDLPTRSGMRQIANLILKADGWELRRLTHARGPYVGARGNVLSISDSVVLGARGPEVDGWVAVAVASWRDGAFDSAHIGRLKDGVIAIESAKSTDLKKWIKEPA